MFWFKSCFLITRMLAFHLLLLNYYIITRLVLNLLNLKRIIRLGYVEYICNTSVYLA